MNTPTKPVPLASRNYELRVWFHALLASAIGVLFGFVFSAQDAKPVEVLLIWGIGVFAASFQRAYFQRARGLGYKRWALENAILFACYMGGGLLGIWFAQTIPTSYLQFPDAVR